MSFSATGNILSGSLSHPNYIAIVQTEPGSRQVDSVACNKWNILGYLPLVSTITGCARILIATVHAIVHLVAAIFCERAHHLAEMRLGLSNIARGLVEVVPLVGNAALLLFDGRTSLSHAVHYLGRPGTAALIEDDREVAFMDLHVYRTLSSPVSHLFDERIEIIRQSAA